MPRWPNPGTAASAASRCCHSSTRKRRQSASRQDPARVRHLAWPGASSASSTRKGSRRPNVQVATMWGAKGVTAEHVYLLGTCDEAIPGRRRDEYPGTEEDYLEEQRRLFYVSITRSKKTLVISRATSAATGEAMRMGLAVEANVYRVDLQMSRFLRDIIKQLPNALDGGDWKGC